MEERAEYTAGEEKPLPCPFCGSTNLYINDDLDKYVLCKDCYANSSWKLYLDEAIAAWNKVPRPGYNVQGFKFPIEGEMEY